MKNILLLVHDDDGQEARLQAALDLTRALDGHLTCVEVSVPPIVVGEYGNAAAVVMLTDLERERETKHAQGIEARLAREDVSWSRTEITGSIAEAVLDAAGLADLIVLNRKLDGHPNPDMRDIASRIVMHARKPVVAVPEGSTRFGLDRALIAWDGGASSEAAVRAATPLLALASDVTVFTVRDGADGTDPAEAAQYLSRHGIHANVRVVDDKKTPADQLIAEEAGRLQADYVVMGAYGHGRLREAFGGVTKRMLTNSKLPLVLGH